MHTFVKVLQRRSERQAYEVMTRGVEQIPAVSWVYIEEDAGDHNGLFLEEFFKESLGKALYTARYPSRYGN